MKNIFIFGLILIFPLGFGWTEVQHSLPTGLAPHPNALFSPLRADPRELHFAMRVAFPIKEVTTAEVAIGHYYGIYRWALPHSIGYAQVNIGGGIFPRFNFSNKKDLQVIDFYGNIPIDVRIRKWSARFMLYHVSSHLGDDYIRTSGQLADRNSWNSVRSLLSYDISSRLRLYGGYTYHFLVHPPEQEKQAFQSGFEMTFNIFRNSQAQAYWANDFQWWERTHWNPQFNSQLGIKMGREPQKGRGISYFLEFTTGPEYFGHFFMRNETRIGVGAKFDIT